MAEQKTRIVYTVSIFVHPCGYSQHVFYDLSKALNKMTQLTADNQGSHYSVSMTKSLINVND